MYLHQVAMRILQIRRVCQRRVPHHGSMGVAIYPGGVPPWYPLHSRRLRRRWNILWIHKVTTRDCSHESVPPGKTATPGSNCLPTASEKAFPIAGARLFVNSCYACRDGPERPKINMLKSTNDLPKSTTQTHCDLLYLLRAVGSTAQLCKIVEAGKEG